MTDTYHLRALLAAATPGPWECEYLPAPDNFHRLTAPSVPGAFAVAYVESCYDMDVSLIAAAVNALPTLLDRLDALEAVAVAAREAFGTYLPTAKCEPGHAGIGNRVRDALDALGGCDE